MLLDKLSFPTQRQSVRAEHQYWTDSILCEGTRTRLEHFQNLGWLSPNYNPRTLEGLAVVEWYWGRHVTPSLSHGGPEDVPIKLTDL